MINMTTMTIEKTTKTTTIVKKPAKVLVSAGPRFGVRIHDKHALMKLTGFEHTSTRRN